MEQSMSYFNIPVIFFSIASLAVSMEYLNLDTEASASFGSNNASINRKTTSNGCHFVRDGSLIDEIVRPANLQQTVDWLKKVRREIHEYPEVAREELQTSELIRRELDLMGVKHRWPIAGTGVVATIGTGLPAFVALGADMDALPILVVSVSSFHGGSSYSTVPDSVTIGGTFRAFTKRSFGVLKQRIEEVIKGQVAVYRCTARLEFFELQHPPIPPTVNDNRIYEYVRQVSKEIVEKLTKQKYSSLLKNKILQESRLHPEIVDYNIQFQN
ncbi:hypothetical protein COCNU_11G008700 [Cocos nucifera]|uniref:Uncharacterized protein n=1 Tax=Cocos nucifera TaxID=13894 RepID=A0A8K0N9P3_COCNU|nr:hypothetical protein COCNU_11G008700 [Cocos nucifera]